MSISIQEALESAGFDIARNPDDARWFLAHEDELEILDSIAEDTIDSIEEEDEE